MLVVTSIDNLSDLEEDALARKHGGLSIIRPDHCYDLENSTCFDYPPEGCKKSRELLTKVNDNLLFKTIEYDLLEDVFLGHYWDVKSLGVDFTFSIMHWEKYMDEHGYYHIPQCVTSAMIVFNFDSKADAMLAKLGIEELRSISVEDYRRLLGEIGQPSVHLPV